MSIFNRLFRKLDTKPIRQENESRYRIIEKEEANSFVQLLEQHAGFSYEKQLIFGDLIGSSSWQFDMGSATISFEELDFPIQIIGSYAFDSNSWMWGWANTQSGIPEHLLVQSNKLKEIGIEKAIDELKDEHFEIDESFAHQVGMIACGLFECNGYYCANYGQGTLVVTILSDEIKKRGQEREITTFCQLISEMELNHKKAFKNYLIDKGYRMRFSENKIEGVKEERHVVASFDDLDRLENLKAHLEEIHKSK